MFLRSIGNLLKVSGCEVPEWIFNLEKIDKKSKKKLEKYPVKRDHIDMAPEK